MQSLIRSLIALCALLCIESAHAAADVVQHVHLSTVDAGFAVVSPAPAGTSAALMLNVSQRFGYAYGIENTSHEAPLAGYDGEFYCAHRIQHAATAHELYAAGQIGSTCGGVALSAFDGSCDFAGTSGHHDNAAFTLSQCSTWNTALYPGGLGEWSRFRTLANGDHVHVLKYAPLFVETWNLGVDDWPAATNSVLTSSIDFDLLYVVAP